MDLSSPLRSLVPSLDSAVLEVLAGTESGLSATQIARLARRGSRAGHSVVLERLVEHGLVIAEPANRGHLYRLNRDHLLADAIARALAVRHELVDRLGAIVDSLQPTPLHASLFGSFARREGDESSDLDLLLVTPDGHDNRDEQWREQIRDLEDRVLAWTGNQLEPLVFSLDQLRSVAEAEEPLVDSLQSEGIVVRGPELDALLGEAPASHVPASGGGAPR